MLGRNTGQYQKMLKAIIKEQIEPIFEKNSFSRNGDLFFKVEPGMVKGVDLEYFRFNTFASFGFWFNVHLFSGDFTGKKKINLKALLMEGTGLYRKRIGALWNEEQHMYRITAATSKKRLAQKMVDDLENYLWPFLDQFQELDDLARLLEIRDKETGSNDYAYMLAIMYAKSGQKPESKRFFTQSLQDAQNPEIQAAIRQTAHFYGVDLDLN